jgi:hypothetical protein
MNTNKSFPRRSIAAASCLALLMGCSSGSSSGSKDVSISKLSNTDTSRSIGSQGSSDTVSANNTAELNAAQPDTVISSTRDLDLGGQGSTQSGPLTYQALGDALKQLGLTPDDEKDSYVMKVKSTSQDGLEWTYPIAISLSQDQSIIWTTCQFAPITGNSDVLASLLAANYQLGTAFFSINEQKTLILQQPLNNVGVTPQILGANLKSFFNCLKESEPLYKSVAAPPAAGGGSGGGGNTNPFQ